MGRIAISKMVMLPHLLYYFVNLPIIVPQSIFNTLNTLLVELIWGKGRRRISLQKLQLESNHGGLGVPDFKAYYYACQLEWLLFWTAEKNPQEIWFTQREIAPYIALRPLRVSSMLYKCYDWLHSQGQNPYNKPPLLRTALQCWKKALAYTSTVTPYSANIPLLGIPTPQGGLTGLGSVHGQIMG